MEDFDASNDEDDDSKEATAIADTAVGVAVADGIGSNSFTLSRALCRLFVSWIHQIKESLAFFQCLSLTNSFNWRCIGL